MIDRAEHQRVQRICGSLMRDFLIFLTQQDGRPITQATQRRLLELCVKVYLEGARDMAVRPTLPAPPHPSEEG